MKKSLVQNYQNLRFYADSVVARRYDTSYYGTAVWRVRKASKPLSGYTYVIYSTGTSRGMYPYIGGSQSYSQMGCAAQLVSDATISEMLCQAQTGEGYWHECHGVILSSSGN